MPLIFLEAHEKLCPLAPVKCKYDYGECTVLVACMDESKHYETNHHDHFDLLEISHKFLFDKVNEYKLNNSELKEFLSQQFSAISMQMLSLQN